jgi:hypothetical protein
MSETGMKLTIVKSYLHGIATQLNLDPYGYQSWDLLADGIGHSIYERHQEAQALKAMVNELRESLDDITECGATGEDTDVMRDYAKDALAKTPQQALASHNAGIEEEVIADLLEKLKDYLEEPAWNHLEHATRTVARKYQSPTNEDQIGSNS